MLFRLLVAVACCQLVLLCSSAKVFAGEEASIRMMRATAIEYTSRGRIDEALGSFDSAIRLAEQAYGHDSTYVADICFDAGLAALRADQYQKAEQCLSRAVSLNPNSVEARLKLAELYKKRAKINEAKQQLQRVLQRHPENLEARELLAMTYQQEGNFLLANKECYNLSQIVHSKRLGSSDVSIAQAPVTPPPVAPATVAPTPFSMLRTPPKPAATPSAPKPKPEPAKKIEPPKKQEPAAKKPEPPKKPSKKEAAKKKSEHPKKPAKKPGKPAQSAVAETGPSSSWGLPARMKSTAVLLTPVKGKGKSASSESVVKPAEQPKSEPAKTETAKKPEPPKAKPSAASIAEEEPAGGEPEEEGFGGSTTSKPRPKPATTAAAPKPKPVVVKIEAPKRRPGGLVPPPPPVVPQFTPMVVPPPPQALAAPKPKPKPVEKPAESAKPSNAHPTEEDGDFLLDWAGKKKK